MTDMICCLVGVLISISIYLMLSAQLMRWLFGLVILSSTINLVLFVAGRLHSTHPAFVTKQAMSQYVDLANPLPQALILTAIVIGFGLLSYALVLVRKLWRTFGTVHSDSICIAEEGHLKSIGESR